MGRTFAHSAPKGYHRALVLTLTFVILLNAAPPVSEDGALRLQGLTLSLESIAREGGPACVARLSRREAQKSRVTVHRDCGVSEVWTAVADGIEHELFVTRAPQGSGALRIHLAAKGPWLERNAEGHVFAGPGAQEGWVYGEAFVVAANGTRSRIDVVRARGGLELVVPPKLAVFPLHIDPLVFPFAERQLAPVSSSTFRPSDSDEADPGVTWSTQGTAVIGVYSDDRRGGGADLFGVVLTADAGIVLDNLLEAPGVQRKPAVVSTRDGGVIVAFEDWNIGVAPTLHVVRLLEQPMPSAIDNVPIPGGRLPALAWDPQQGVMLGFAANGVTPVVVSVDALFAGSTTPTWTFPLAAGQLVDTALAARNGHTALIVQSATNAVYLIEDGALVMLPPTIGERAQPTVSMSDVQGELHAAWTEPVGNSSLVRYWSRTAMGGGSDVIPDSFSPSLSFFQNRVTVTAFTSVLDGGAALTFNDVSAGVGYLRSGALPLARDQGLSDLITEVRGGTLAAGWISRTPVEQGNVEFALVTARSDGGVLGQFFPVQGQPMQHDVRVSYFDDVGLAVWREGGDTIRARWLDRTGAAAGNAGVFTLMTARPLERFDGLDVAVGPSDGYIAVRGVFPDGAQSVRSTFVTRLLGAGSLRDGPVLDFSVLRGGTSKPHVAWDGNNFRLATTRATDIEVVVVNGNGTSMPNTVTTRGAAFVDLACFEGQCRVAYVSPMSGDIFLVDPEDSATPVRVDTATGPLSLSHDGQRFIVAYVVSDLSLQVPQLALATVVPRSPPVLLANRLPLITDTQEGIFLEDISLAATSPPVVAIDDTLHSRTWLVDTSSAPPWPFIDASLSPHAVATTRNAASGVVVFERFAGALTGQAWVVPFGIDGGAQRDAGIDAGPVADGGADGGTDGGSVDTDGGPSSDAGASDGGAGLLLNSSGCGCSSGDGGSWWLVLVAFAALLWRRRAGVLLAGCVVLAAPAFAQLQVVDQHVLSDARGSDRLSNDAHSPTVAVNDAGVAVLVWVDTRRGDDDLFVARTDGTTTPIARPLIINFQPQSHPALTTEGLDFLLAWQEGTLQGQEVHLIKVDGQTLQVLKDQKRTDARAPSLTTQDGRAWIGFQSLTAQAGQLILQPADDFFTAGSTSNTFVIQGVDAGVMRTAISVNDGYNAFAAETPDALLFFNKGTFTDVRALVQPAASVELRNAAVFTGPGSNDAWIAVERVGGNPVVDLLHFTNPMDGTPTIRSFVGRTSPAFTVIKPSNVLATFDLSNNLHFDDLELAGTSFPAPMVAAISPSQLTAASFEAINYFAWTNGAAPNRDVSLLRIDDPLVAMRTLDLSPVSPILQTSVEVSFFGGRGVAAWRYGKNTTFLTWIGHVPGSNSITLSGAPLQLVSGNNNELIDLDVAMGDEGALVARRSKNANGMVLELTYVSRTDGSNTTVFGGTTDGRPSVSFDGQEFHASHSLNASLTTINYVVGSPPSVVPLTTISHADTYALDCLPAPVRSCALIFCRAPGSPGWAFVGGNTVDLSVGSGPVSVTNDGAAFHLFWRLPSQRLSHAEVKPAESLTLTGTIQPPGFDVAEVTSAPGSPPWLAVGDRTGAISVSRLGGGFLSVTEGRGVDLTSLDASEGLAAMVFMAFDDPSASMLPHVVLVRDLSIDAGPVEPEDAGMVDAGPVVQKDGGSGKGDGGTEAPLTLFSTSCGCSEASGLGVLAWVLGALAMARRRR